MERKQIEKVGKGRPSTSIRLNASLFKSTTLLTLAVEMKIPGLVFPLCSMESRCSSLENVQIFFWFPLFLCIGDDANRTVTLPVNSVYLHLTGRGMKQLRSIDEGLKFL